MENERGLRLDGADFPRRPGASMMQREPEAVPRGRSTLTGSRSGSVATSMHFTFESHIDAVDRLQKIERELHEVLDLLNPGKSPDAPTEGLTTTLDASTAAKAAAQNWKDTNWFLEAGQTKHAYVIDPQSPQRLLWDMLILAAVVVESIVVPLGAGFDFDSGTGWLIVSTTGFAVDFVLNCWTGFFKEGVMVMQQPAVLCNYAKGFMLLDFVTTVPWEFVGFRDGGDIGTAKALKTIRIVRLVRMLRLLKLTSLFKKIKDYLPSGTSATWKVSMTLLKIALMMTFLGHLIACGWGFIGGAGIGSDDGNAYAGWVSDYLSRDKVRADEDNMDKSNLYVVSISWAVGLFLGTELEVMAVTFGERVYQLVIMMVGFPMTTVLLANLVDVVTMISRVNAVRNDKMDSFDEFLRHMRISTGLKQQLLRCAHQSLLLGEKTVVDTIEWLHAFVLPPALSSRFEHHIRREILLRYPPFLELSRIGGGDSIVHQLIGKSAFKEFEHGTVIARAGNPSDVFIIPLRGRLVTGDADDDEEEPLKWVGEECLEDDDALIPHTVVAQLRTEVLLLLGESAREILSEVKKVVAEHAKSVTLAKKLVAGSVEAPVISTGVSLFRRCFPRSRDKSYRASAWTPTARPTDHDLSGKRLSVKRASFIDTADSRPSKTPDARDEPTPDEKTDTLVARSVSETDQAGEASRPASVHEVPMPVECM